MPDLHKNPSRGRFQLATFTHGMKAHGCTEIRVQRVVEVKTQLGYFSSSSSII